MPGVSLLSHFSDRMRNFEGGIENLPVASMVELAQSDARGCIATTTRHCRQIQSSVCVCSRQVWDQDAEGVASQVPGSQAGMLQPGTMAKTDVRY